MRDTWDGIENTVNSEERKYENGEGGLLILEVEN